MRDQSTRKLFLESLEYRRYLAVAGAADQDVVADVWLNGTPKFADSAQAAGSAARAANKTAGVGTQLVILPSGDRLPAVAAKPDVVLNGDSWRNSIRSTQDVVIPAGKVVTINSLLAKADEIRVEGTLRFSPTRDTRLEVTTLLVTPLGRLEIAPQDSRSAEIVIRDQIINTNLDPDTMGNGVLVMGKANIQGQPKTTFARLAQAPKSTDSVLVFEAPVQNWRPGDVLILADSRALSSGHIRRGYEPADETVVVKSVNRNTITLFRALKHDHPGNEGLNPYVANLSRNVTIKSKNPKGVRGHFLVTGHAEAAISYARFHELGRTTTDSLNNTRYSRRNGSLLSIGTNQAGRYSLHFHHTHGRKGGDPSGYQFRAIGNAIDGAPKWGLAVHGSSFGRVAKNVVYRATGSGIVTEDGSEVGNLIEENFSAVSFGTRKAVYDRNNLNRLDVGHQGAGFWFSGVDNIVRNNVAANAHFGFAFFTLEHERRVPKIRGADPQNDSQWKMVHVPFVKIREIRDNEYYGVQSATVSSAMDIHKIGMDIRSGFIPNVSRSYVDGFTAWNFNQKGVMSRFINKLTYRNIVLTGLPRGSSATGMTWQKHVAIGVVVDKADISGMNTGIIVPNATQSYGSKQFGEFIVQKSRFRNNVDIRVSTLFSPSIGRLDAKLLPGRSVRIVDTTMKGRTTVKMAFYNPKKPKLMAGRNILQKDTVLVQNSRGQNYRVYYVEQDANFKPRPSSVARNYVGAPGNGNITNQQLMNYKGVAIAGAIAPASATKKDGVFGLVVFISDSNPSHQRRR